MKALDYSKLDVLIVDDDKNICEILKEYCESLEIFRHVIIANDGVLATLKLKNQIFSLIIMDINMPKKNGKSIIEELAHNRNINKPESILVISGELDKDVITECIGYGIKNFLAKPFDEKTFKEKVQKIIKK